MALSESYDLVILDIMLPKKDGFAVLKSLREEGLETPVLMLTARGEVHDRVAGLNAEDDEEEDDEEDDDDNENKEN
ncbi:response regulator [candidate division KSB1 bacterium]|nr:response regulator [candidate division KSB1 bacterium]